MGPFPLWAHNLRKLVLLNLGQNDISGEIPLVIGEGRIDGGRQLKNLREIINRLGTSDLFFRSRDRDRLLKLKFNTFLREHAYIIDAKDLLWVDVARSYWEPINLREVIEEYIKAEENRLLLTRIYHSIRKLDPVLLIESFNSASTHPKLN